MNIRFSDPLLCIGALLTYFVLYAIATKRLSKEKSQNGRVAGDGDGGLDIC